MKPPNRRHFLKMTAAATAAYVTHRATPAHAARPASTEASAGRPNIVFVFSDTHRWQSMSFTEMPGMSTPNMARMANQGLSMNRTISNFPICSPYRAMLMTGLWPYQQAMLDGGPGMIDNGLWLSPFQWTLGKSFQSAGYRTGYVGKWHLGGISAAPHGFDHSIVWPDSDDHWSSSHVSAAGNDIIDYDGYNPVGMTDQAISFMEQHQAESFFLMLSLNPPHEIFTDAPARWQELYADEDTLPLRPNVDLGNAPADFREQYRGYHAHISAVDYELGRIMQRLTDLGLANDTILVYTSDHGSMFQSHALLGKRKPWEESIRVPFLIQWPGRIAPGTTSDALFGTIDHMPTLLGLAGLTVPDSCAGMDFSPLMLGETMQTPNSQFIMGMPSWPVSFRGVTTDRYTLAYMDLHRDEPHVLYDNEQDPFQLHNRFEDPELAEVRERLTWELAQHLELADDPVSLSIRTGYLPNVASRG